MDWPIVILIIFGSLVVLMATGVPVAIAFMVINLFGVYLLWGGGVGLEQLILSMAGSVSTFALVAIPLFVLMGDILFNANIGPNMMDAIDKWIGRLPGRLSFIAVAAGTLFSALTGASMASVAMLGSVLIPEMEKRGYKKQMTIGPILGSSGLAIMIPPSSLAVLLGAIGEISVGRVLMAIIIPGLLMAVLYAAYILIRSGIQPHLAPPYAVGRVPWSERFVALAKHILPAGIVVFMVIGVMLLGVATPSEAAATGTLGMFILAFLYRSLTWKVLKKSLSSTLNITVMLLIIITGATAFGQILAFSGASRGLADFTTGLPVPPIFIVFAMQIVLFVLGMFMNVTSIMMITLPLFVPVVEALGFDTVWFAVIYLLNMEMATTSPPFGMSLFVMKGVAPRDTTMGDIYGAALPFLACDFIAMVLIMAFPALALWLPSVMR